MLGILLDTNIYGKLIELEGNERIVEKMETLKNEKKIIIHNFRVIRDELRNAKAINTLILYDKLTANTIHILDDKVEELAALYFKVYEKNGGIQKKTQNFMNDMRIVAFATIKGLDIVCSDDIKAFHTKLMQDSYKEVNVKYLYRGPYFFTLNDLKKAWLRAYMLQHYFSVNQGKP